MERYRYIDTGKNSATWNMSIDEALLNNYQSKNIPLLRIYEWETSLSFGRFSKLDESLSMDHLNDIDHTRRLSGGGILTHGGDISYTLIVPKKFVKELGVKRSYSYLCGFLIEFYKRLGLKAEFLSDTTIEPTSSKVCLAGLEPYDIVIEGKKIGGNAQRYTKGLVYQHGSIPIEFNEKIFEPLFLDSSGVKESATLFKLGIDKTKKQLKELLIESFCDHFDCEIYNDSLDNDELKNVKELYSNKYSQKSWNIKGKKDA